ncbi:MAG: hypothetical protein P8P30_03690 [Rickettsiales bacterium]|nr:hypothetical protein [Rickettsiales bacterium]
MRDIKPENKYYYYTNEQNELVRFSTADGPDSAEVMPYRVSEAGKLSNFERTSNDAALPKYLAAGYVSRGALQGVMEKRYFKPV